MSEQLIRALVRYLLLNRMRLPANDWTMQGFGFLRLRINDSMRLHVWDPVSGKSARNRDHAVIYKDGQLWHDPHPESSGIKCVEQADFFYPLDPFSSTAQQRIAELEGYKEKYLLLSAQHVREIEAAEAEVARLREELAALQTRHLDACVMLEKHEVRSDEIRARLDPPVPDVEDLARRLMKAENFMKSANAKAAEWERLADIHCANKETAERALEEVKTELTQEREHVWALYEAIGYSKDRNIQTGDSPFDCIAELTAAQTALKHAGEDARSTARWSDRFTAIDAALSASEPEGKNG